MFEFSLAGLLLCDQGIRYIRYNLFTVRYTGSGRPVSRAGAHDKSE